MPQNNNPALSFATKVNNTLFPKKAAEGKLAAENMKKISQQHESNLQKVADYYRKGGR